MKFIKYWGPAVAWMGIIFLLSSRPTVKISETFAVQFLFFKSLHVIEYGFLYILVFRAFHKMTTLPDWKLRFHAFLVCVAYAISDEVHQVFVVTREGTVRDILIDTLGIFISFYILWKLLPKAPPKLKNWGSILGVI